MNIYCNYDYRVLHGFGFGLKHQEGRKLPWIKCLLRWQAQPQDYWHHTHNEEPGGRVRRRGNSPTRGYGRSIKDGGRYLSLPTDQTGTMSSKSYVEVPGCDLWGATEKLPSIYRASCCRWTHPSGVIDGGHIQSKHVHNLYTGGKPRPGSASACQPKPSSHIHLLAIPAYQVEHYLR